MIDAYCYMFYKFYKFWDIISIPNFWSDWKAELSIDVLDIFILYTGISYYNIITDNDFDFENGPYFELAYLALIALPNYLLFHRKNQWNEIIRRFDKWPRKRNRVGGIIVIEGIKKEKRVRVIVEGPIWPYRCLLCLYGVL